jgi:hypothetical protein
MSSNEFEKEAKEKSALGAAVLGPESIFRKREGESIMEAKGKVQRHATLSPGEPPDEMSSPYECSGG